MVSKAFSVEDGNLNSRSLVTNRKKLFSDIDLSFTAKPSGDVYKKVDVGAVKQSVRNILMSNHGDKPFQPLFGANLRDLLFDLAEPELAQDINRYVRAAIGNYEPRAAIQQITTRIDTDRNSVAVGVQFSIINSTEIATVEVQLARLR